MKRSLYVFILLVLPMLSFAAQPDAAFAKGNAFYAKGNYKEALAAYRQVADAGYQSAALYFNMGNANYKSDDIPSAIWYYEKAHKLSPGDDDINFNILYANQKTTDKIVETPRLFISEWWDDLILSLPADTFAAVGVLLMLAASAALIIYFFSRVVIIKRASFYTAAVLFTLGIFTVFIAGRQAAYFSGHLQAIVFTGSVPVKSGPLDQAGTLFILHDGTKVNVLENNNGWLKIQLANGTEGWLKAADVKEI